MTMVATAGLVVVTEPAQASTAAGQVTLVSHTPVGPATAPIGSSGAGSISADGAFVVFTSIAPNLVTGQSGTETFNVFLFERATGTVTVVSHVPASSTTTGNDLGADLFE